MSRLSGGPWFILSARHGLLHPLQWVGPYDMTLAELSVAERRAWGARVAAQLDAAIGRTDGAIVVLAGRLYRQPLEPWIGGRARVPMLGLGIGRQKAWLAAQLAEPGRRR